MISDELKAIVENIKEQGKMAFLEGATEEQIAKFEKSTKSSSRRSIRIGFSTPMVVNAFFLPEFSFMV